MERPGSATDFPRIASAPRLMDRLQQGDDGSGPRLINRRRPNFINVEHFLRRHGGSFDQRTRVASRILALATHPRTTSGRA